MTRILSSLAEISGDYAAILCDVWGVVHNGLRVHPAAMAALAAHRAKGGVAALLTNAPRPHTAVQRQLEAMNAPQDAYDFIVTSGDATRAALASGEYGRRCHHLGPAKDLPIFDGFDVERVSLDEAEYIFCTGLHDDRTETPEDYVDLIGEGVSRGLKLLCANPDIVVDYGDLRLYCAGAIAQAYTQAGGDSVYFGKPYAAIYAHAFERLAAHLGTAPEPARVLAIGDGIATDVSGARDAGLDCVFIASGLAAGEILRPDGEIAPERLEAFLTAHGMAPRYALPTLR